MDVNKKIYQYDLINFLIVSMFIYSPLIVLGSIQIDTNKFFILILFFVSIILFFNGYKKINLTFDTYLFLLLFIMLIIFSYSMVNYIYIGDGDKYMLSKSIYLVIYFIVALLISNYYFNINFKIDSFFRSLYIATFLHSLIILFMAYNESFRIIIQSIQPKFSMFQRAGDIRMAGINGMAGAHLSFLHFLGGISYIYIKNMSNLIKFIMLLVIILAMFYIARTGLVFLIIVSLIYFMFVIRKKFGFLGFMFIFLVVLVPSLILFIYYTAENLNVNSSAIYRTLSFIPAMISEKTLLPPVVTFLMENYYFLPENTSDIWFGVVGFKQFDENILGYRSDVGYIKFIFSIGMFGQILYMLFYILIFFVSMKYKKYESRLSYVLVSISTLFIFHGKEVGFANNIFNLVILIAFFMLVLNAKRNKIIKGQLNE